MPETPPSNEAERLAGELAWLTALRKRLEAVTTYEEAQKVNEEWQLPVLVPYLKARQQQVAEQDAAARRSHLRAV